MAKKSVRDVDVSGKRVLVRVDFNVPLEGDRITDDTRIRAALPTINYLVERGARVLLISHLGRPKGVDEKFRMDPIAKRLAELVSAKVTKVDDCVGDPVKAAADALQPGEILMLENSRFHPEEEANDPEFSRRLAELCDVFVEDAFGSCHRAHATTEGVTHYVPAVAGFLVEKEIEFLQGALDNPKRPLVVILGGAKVSDKLGVIENLLDKADALLIGGGMAFTFLKAKGYEVGKSLLDEEKVEMCATTMRRAKERNIPLMLPTDVLVADALSPGANTHVVPADRIPPDWMGVDVGPVTIERFVTRVRGGEILVAHPSQRVLGQLTSFKEVPPAGTVIWNGPLGVFEMEPFAEGTRAVAAALAEITEKGAITIIGGGDSAAAVTQMGFADRVTHISTGGGASLELMEGKVLPGIAALDDK